MMATILAVPLFPQIAGAKASDGYNTTGAIFSINCRCQSQWWLQYYGCHFLPQIAGVKPVMATILRVPFFPLIAGAKASGGYNTTGAIFCHRLQG